jgi:ligand-binding sensor protein
METKTTRIDERLGPPLETWTAAERKELLDPAAWADALKRYADGTGLAVALANAEGRLVGDTLNAKPFWKMIRAAPTIPDGNCPFCLRPCDPCPAVEEAVKLGQPALTVDAAGLAHVAIPLTLDGMVVGLLLAAQVFEKFPEQLPIERAAREFGLSPQTLWRIAREQRPFGRDRLVLCGRLLAALGQSLLSARAGEIAERRRVSEIISLSRDVAEHQRLVAAMRDSRQQLEIALAGSGAVTWQWRAGTGELD